MQSSPEHHPESNPVAVLAAEAQPTQSKPDAPAQTTTAPEAPGSMALTPPMMKKLGVQSQAESRENTGKTDTDPNAKPSAQPEPVADTVTSSGSDGQKVMKQSKGASDGRKYVLSKKAMVDPLKMDMSKPVVMPLTSSQLSLHCIECHIIFSDFKSKERHIKQSHPAEYEQCILRNSLFACYVCDRHFTNSADLMAHQKAHPDKKPFKCPICGLSFKKSSELTSHKKIHFGQDGYACNECGKSCKTLTLLRYHQRTHSGEKPYVCKECGKRFPLPKFLQKHIESHSLDGAEGDEAATASKAKRKTKKTDDASAKVYLCSVCKATFKSSKTRQHHMKTKHKLPAVTKPLVAGLQGKQSTPVITPITISQPTLLQVEPNGPLQKVDANIDTEQIRKLIESLGNVQKVNQVVILGQVPPHAPPLEVQQVSQPAEMVDLSLGPPQIDFIGLKPAESKTLELDPSVDPMEQTIILEPITPEGQLENPAFSNLGSHVAAGEHVTLTFVQAEHTERLEREAMHQNLQQSEISPMNSDPSVCQNEAADLKENLEQTFILELTPALIPAEELEQCQTEPQNKVSSSSVDQTTEQESPDQSAGHTVQDAVETNMPVPSPTTTGEFELTSTHPEEKDLASCPAAPPETLTQAPSEPETTSKENINSDAEKVGLDQINDKTNKKDKQDLCEKVPAEHKSNLSEDPAAKEEALSKLETKKHQQNSELPVSVMSAQELVKVRKRKPARTFFFQGYMHDLVGSIYKDDFQIDAKPAKRQRTKKSCLVVKFGPQSKDKKSKKQKKPEQEHQPIQDSLIKNKTPPKKLPEKVQKVQPQKKTGKGKKEKAENMLSGSDAKSPSTHTPQVKQIKEDAKKNKMKKQKETKGDVVQLSEQKPVAPTMLKKKKATKILQKDQPKNPKEVKGKKNLSKAQKVKKAEAIDANINQDSLLLLKGHKQPQLKVYKLDTSKASGPTQEDSPHDFQSIEVLPAGRKKKAGRTQKKGLSLLSSLHITRQQSETVPTKPKSTRKRKAPLNVETEGVITSKRALECKDCGEKFSEVASLQKHKTTAHVIESPGLTYTNGNVFEGVSGFDLYRLPKEHGGVVRVMNAPTDWDTEPEIGEMALEDRDRGVSFPALIPSPSLQIPPQDVEIGTHEHKSVSKTGIEDHFSTSCDLQSSSDEPKDMETQPNVTTETSFTLSTETKSSDTGEPLASDEDKQEDPAKNLSYESKVQGTADEDFKEDLLLDVDLVTVGEQEERDDPLPQIESNRVYGSKSEITEKNHEQVSNETREISLASQTVSCSTHRVEVKEEEEETLVQNRKETVKEVSVTGQSRRAGFLNRDVLSRKGSIVELEHEQDECRIVYEKQPLLSDLETADHEISKTTQTSPEFKTIKRTLPAASLPSVRAIVEESSEEPVVLELGSLTPSLEEVMSDRGPQREEERDSDQSPGIILERFLTSRQRATADRETSSATGRSSQPQGLGSITENEVQVVGEQEIKVEENSSDPLFVAPTCPNRQRSSVQPKHHQDIRSILVKEETNSVLNDTQGVQGSRHMRWNVEPVCSENTDIQLPENGETMKDCHVTPDFNSNQCIFYPVKEEVREVPLEATTTSTGCSTPEGSGNANPTDLQSTDCNANERRSSPLSYQESGVAGLPSEPSIGDLTDGHAASDSEWQNPSDLRDFLLQGSDDEDTSSFELSEPQLDKEAEIMSYFNQDQTSSKQLPHQSSSKGLPNSARHLQAPDVDNRTKKPIDYFSEYFSWDTWVEVAFCTNKLSKMPNPVTCREVAHFVGIHVAMGTLKFPSARLYWEDLTKVPLIAEAMSLNRFLELSRLLKLFSSNDPKQNGQQLGNTHRSSQSLVSDHSASRCSADPNSSQTQTDPLWKVRPLLHRFNAGCRSLRQQGDYAVDQYPVGLTGKIHDNTPFLHCTTLIGLNGLITHVDLEPDLSEKQGAVEKMIPKGSMVFLCKQELSTPAMLECLLAAGIHGAGRVGGARGQIGDEFVSSDGKLMLRRTHCGFILCTAGNGQRNMASLIDSFEKAQMSAHLNRDLQNLYSTPLTVSSPTCWPQAVLWHLTDMALVNSWLLYRQDHRATTAPLTFMAFRLEVSKALILSSGSDNQDSIPPQPPEENAYHAISETPSPVLLEESPLPGAATRYDGSGHWPEQLAEGEGGRCRFRDCQRTSRVLCLKCCVFLCISRNHNCFLNFHSQESTENE